MKNIPLSLIIFRLIAGIFFLFIPSLGLSFYKELMIILLVTGLLSDVFDGIIARKLGVSTEKLRRLDSSIDQVFWICISISLFILHPDFFKEHALKFFLLADFEVLIYIISYLKFRREVSTHAILSKIWTLTLLALFVELIGRGNSGWLFDLCFYLGMISRAEIAAILFSIREWTTDVPSFYHALQLRKGKTIKRNKYFNG
jgi:CDP-diacylglycerol--glycerol-3-phosphate 3-phosphatidyltransferase